MLMIEVSSVLPDQDLAAGLAANLDACFEQLVVSYQQRIYAFALRLSGSPQDAEEIAQDAFVRAYRALAGYSQERITALALRPWLYQITLNVFRNRVRGYQPRLVPLDEMSDAGATPLLNDTREQPDAVLERIEREHELESLVLALPERYRVAVVLRHIEGFNYQQLADMLSQPVGTVKANVHRGTRLLRTALTNQRNEVRNGAQ